jgi:hypothetical protein
MTVNSCSNTMSQRNVGLHFYDFKSVIVAGILLLKWTTELVRRSTENNHSSVRCHESEGNDSSIYSQETEF